MKTFLVSFLTLAFLLASSPVQAGGWAEDLFEWVTGLFSRSTSSETTAFSPAQLDSLRSSPGAASLLTLADADTLIVNGSWPYESLSVANDLERYQRLLQKTVVVTNPEKQLPFLEETAARIVYRATERPSRFIEMAQRFADIQEVPYHKVIPDLLPYADAIPTIIVVSNPPGLVVEGSEWYESLFNAVLPSTVLVNFGNPDRVNDIPENWAFLTCPQQTQDSEAFLAQAIFGAQLLDGRLDKDTPQFRAGSGERLTATRSGFRIPELFGIDRAKLERVDYHINRGIRYRAMPGAQLLVMKDGHVVYEKAYGHHVYRQQAVSPGDLYDLASITKAAATTLAVMKLYDQNLIRLEASVRDYLPEFKNKPLGRYTIEQLLTHHSGLQAELPVEDFLGKQYVSLGLKEDFEIPLGNNRYLDNGVPGEIRQKLQRRVNRSRRPSYRYSDLNYYLLQLVIENITEERLDIFIDREFYTPLGLGRITFRPAGVFPDQRIVPTVYDHWMRGGLLRGYVHDEGAALLGGIGGHAGLFSNARDLGLLFQFLLDGGDHGGQQLLEPTTIERFIARNQYNYRALGFDRLAGGWPNVVSAGASSQTFGHLGFTGTSVWADPENDLVFVLLTNRVYPNPKRNKFRSMRIRGKVHRDVYRALDTWEMNS